ncbi:hypothetical protein OG339_39440 [Streptosporangium sp. NBC_01495]|uniref:hypothetical protein n=1 Tax=Streptosporangium sp. NBC_01495 TaxID=2903899 RepID=UPI002E307205|nr:hypothetical protein [Streptosporangium sp. NBC_01495]
MSDQEDPAARQEKTTDGTQPVDGWGNANLVLSAAVPILGFIIEEELTTNALLGALIFATVGIGLRIEAAIKSRR